MNNQHPRILRSLMIVSLISFDLPIKAMHCASIESMTKKAKFEEIPQEILSQRLRSKAEQGTLTAEDLQPPFVIMTGDSDLLHIAARHGHREVVELLLNRGSPIDEPNNEYDKNTALHLASSNGHTDVVRVLLSRGAKTEIRNASRLSALHMAAKNGHREVVKLLLDKGAKRDVVCRESHTALDWAAYNGHRQTVELLLNRGAKNKGHHVGSTLSCAAENWHPEVVELLLDRHYQVDSVNEDNNCTALHYAVHSNKNDFEEPKPINSCLEVVELLLNRGANIEHPDKNGKTVLFKAAMNGKREVVELLLRRGARLAACDEHGLTALHGAAINGHREVVELLLGRGAQINACTSHQINDFDRYCNTMLYPFQHKTIKKGMTALHFAAMRHQRDVVDLLISEGADLNALNEKEETPLYLAVEWNDYYETLQSKSKHKGVVKLLLFRNAQVDAQTSYGLTPLARASMYGNDGPFPSKDLGSQRREIVQLLLNANAAITTTALHAPAEYGYSEVVELLLDSGALIDALDEHGNTPLHFAIDNNKRNVVELLIKKGADTDLLNEKDRERYQAFKK